MEHRTIAARLHALRNGVKPSRKLGEGAAEDVESGFTLIELMVVLLIMAILLAIAIPTFLSVTGGAKRTAAQSNLTNTLQSIQALTTNHGGTLPSTLVGATGTLKKTQTSITYVAGTQGLTTKTNKGKNVVSVTVTAVGTIVTLSALDAASVCWGVKINPTSSTPTTGTPPGDHFVGTKTLTVCTAASVAALGITKFGKTFKTTKLGFTKLT